MSHRLNQLNSDWKKLQEYLHQCPHLPKNHALIEAALEGSQNAKEELEDKIRDDYPIEFEWERFVEASQKKGANDTQSLSLPVEDLGVDQLQYLLKQTQDISSNQSDLLRDVELCTERGQDLSDVSLPLMVKFLKQGLAKHLCLSFGRRNMIRISTTIERPDDLDRLPHITPFQNLAIFSDDAFPNLSKLTAPPVVVTHLDCDGYDRLEFRPVPVHLLECILQLGRNLIEFSLSNVVVHGIRLREMVEALQNSLALESFILEKVVFEGLEAETNLIEHLIQGHDKLSEIWVMQSNESDHFVGCGLWWPRSGLQCFPSISRLRSLSLPMNEADSERVLPIVTWAARSEAMQSLNLGGLLTLERSADTGRLDLGFGKYGEEDHETDMLAVVPQLISKLATLRLHRALPTTLDAFKGSSCVVSCLEVSEPLDSGAMAHLASCLQAYSQLKQLKLYLCVSSVITRLCPKSSLKELDLHFRGGSRNTAFPVLALVLNEQKELEVLRTSYCGRQDPEFDAVPAMANTVRDHPSLSTMMVSNALSHHMVADALFGAVEHNNTIQTLGFLRVSRDSNRKRLRQAVIDGIPKAKHLRNLVLSAGFAWFSSSQKSSESLESALTKENLSICNVTICDDFRQMASIVFDCEQLTRNKLLLHAREVSQLQRQLTLGLWPNVLAKLGSNKREGTPVYALLKQGTSAFAAIATKKRRRPNN